MTDPTVALRRSAVGKYKCTMKCGIGVSDKDDGIQCKVRYV